MGIKTVVNLRRIGEHMQGDEEKAVKADGMRYVSVPMRGMATPTNEDVSKVLALLGDPAAGPVFVHCKRGADRTGTVIACYRISHDNWENRKALTEARSFGMSRLEQAMQHFVLRFVPVQAGLEAASVH
jgi:protein tyrosine/serine phosphatase